MDDQITDSPYRILARERSHEEARQTVATNRMIVQSLVIINGGAATGVLADLDAHNVSGPMFGNVFGIARWIASETEGRVVMEEKEGSKIEQSG